MVVLVVCFGQFFESLRINAVLDVRTIDAKNDDLPAALYGHLCCGTERYVLKRCGRGVSLLWFILSASEVVQTPTVEAPPSAAAIFRRLRRPRSSR